MPVGFLEQFVVRRGQERLNGGPWRPLGTLAAEVFLLPGLPPGAEHWPAWLLRHWRRLFASLEADTERVLRVFGSESPTLKAAAIRRVLAHRRGRPVPFGAARIETQLSTVRRVAEVLVGAPSSSRYRPPRMADYAMAARATVRWHDAAEDEETFHATPAGAVLLSAVYGRFRGGLRLCGSCHRFDIFPRKGPERKYCDACRTPRAPRPDRATGLPRSKREVWQRVLPRMERRGFKRQGLTSSEARRQWKATFLTALREAKTRGEIWEVEKQLAPEGRPGRPPGSSSKSVFATRAHGGLRAGG